MRREEALESLKTNSDMKVSAINEEKEEIKKQLEETQRKLAAV